MGALRDDPVTEQIVFYWSRKHGDCQECGRPAAYVAVDAYGPGRDQKLCSVCAAFTAAEGQPIARIEAEVTF
jgi:hypothetical protein